MRFFKHGSVLAITLPESLRKAAGVKEGDEFDFAQPEPGVFVLVEKGRKFKGLASEAKPAKAAKAIEPSTKAVESSKTVLDEKGFVVLDNEFEAKRLSGELEKEVKRGNVIGVRGFDKKYYVVSKEFLKQASDKVLRELSKRDCNAKELALASKLRLDACIAALCILKEEGEVIEKRKGVFSAVK